MVYDLVIIGGGPAGYNSAARAGKAGMQVLMIEKNKVGGTCLNEGCIPSKAFLYSAKVYDYVNNAAKYGIQIDSNKTYVQALVVERKNKIVKKLSNSISYLLKSSNVEYINGEAFIKGKKDGNFEIAVDGNTYVGKKLLIATGSYMEIPNIRGLQDSLKSGYAVTHKEVFDMNEVPSNLLIIGGGAVGMEMASYFNSIGCKVSIVESQDRIAGFFDKEMSDILYRIYKKKGIDFYLNSRVEEIKENSVLIKQDNEEILLSPQNVLVCTGRKPAVNGFGLDNIGVTIENDAVWVDSMCRTNIENVYAAGDVNGKFMLAHVAYREADVIINNITGKSDMISYNSVPNIIFGSAEAALAGETENTALQKGIEYKKILIPMQYSGRFVVENEPGNEMCKILVHAKTRKLLGIQMIGLHSSEIIYGVTTMIGQEMDVDEIQKLIFPHPTVSEIIRYGIQEFD